MIYLLLLIVVNYFLFYDKKLKRPTLKTWFGTHYSMQDGQVKNGYRIITVNIIIILLCAITYLIGIKFHKTTEYRNYELTQELTEVNIVDGSYMLYVNGELERLAVHATPVVVDKTIMKSYIKGWERRKVYTAPTGLNLLWLPKSKVSTEWKHACACSCSKPVYTLVINEEHTFIEKSK